MASTSKHTNERTASTLGRNFDNQIVDDEDIEYKVIEHFRQYVSLISLYDVLAMFFIKHGAICSTIAVKKLEGEKRIEVLRNPAQTAKGNATSFMDESKGKLISVRWLQ